MLGAVANKVLVRESGTVKHYSGIASFNLEVRELGRFSHLFLSSWKEGVDSNSLPS